MNQTISLKSAFQKTKDAIVCNKIAFIIFVLLILFSQIISPIFFIEITFFLLLPFFLAFSIGMFQYQGRSFANIIRSSFNISRVSYLKSLVFSVLIGTTIIVAVILAFIFFWIWVSLVIHFAGDQSGIGALGFVGFFFITVVSIVIIFLSSPIYLVLTFASISSLLFSEKPIKVLWGESFSMVFKDKKLIAGSYFLMPFFFIGGSIHIVSFFILPLILIYCTAFFLEKRSESTLNT